MRFKQILLFIIGILCGFLSYYFISSFLKNPNTFLRGGVIPIITPLVQEEEIGRNGETPQLKVETILDGLSNPWDIVFLDSDTFIYSERNNRINLYENGKSLVLAQPADTNVLGEGGMLGLALDPELNYLYACFNSNLSGTLDVRVARFTFNETRTELTERLDIVSGMPANPSGRHSGCQLEFGPDGFLYIGTGDAANHINPQDPASLGGKILRVDKNGTPVHGNLTSPFDPRIYSYGHRNVQGLAFLREPDTNGIIGYSTEHGSDKDDELNPLTPGNFGWSPLEGYNESVAMTDSIKYPDAITAVWSSGKPTIAVSGLSIITGEQWGAWQRRLALGVQKGSRVRLLEIDNQGKLISEEDILNTYGRIRTVQMGPDGNMYVLTDNGGGKDLILKVTPQLP